MKIQASQFTLILQIRNLTNPVVLQPKRLQTRVLFQIFDKREALRTNERLKRKTKNKNKKKEDQIQAHPNYNLPL